MVEDDVELHPGEFVYRRLHHRQPVGLPARVVPETASSRRRAAIEDVRPVADGTRLDPAAVGHHLAERLRAVECADGVETDNSRLRAIDADRVALLFRRHVERERCGKFLAEVRIDHGDADARVGQFAARIRGSLSFGRNLVRADPALFLVLEHDSRRRIVGHAGAFRIFFDLRHKHRPRERRRRA